MWHLKFGPTPSLSTNNDTWNHSESSLIIFPRHLQTWANSTFIWASMTSPFGGAWLNNDKAILARNLANWSGIGLRTSSINQFVLISRINGFFWITGIPTHFWAHWIWRFEHTTQAYTWLIKLTELKFNTGQLQQHITPSNNSLSTIAIPSKHMLPYTHIPRWASWVNELTTYNQWWRRCCKLPTQMMWD
jgi:hypothetical protein